MIECKVTGCPFNDGLYCRILKGVTLDTMDKRRKTCTSLLKRHLPKAKPRHDIGIIYNRFNLRQRHKTLTSKRNKKIERTIKREIDEWQRAVLPMQSSCYHFNPQYLFLFPDT